MSDRFPTEIHIGGKVKRIIIPALLDAINAEGLQDTWGNAMPDLTSETELLERLENGHLSFFDAERAWGEFPDLERFLVENNIAFNRSHSPRYEYSGELVQFRTGMSAPAVAVSNDQGTILIEAPEVQRVRDALKEVLESGLSLETVHTHTVQGVLDELNALCLEADIKPLPAFEIED